MLNAPKAAADDQLTRDEPSGNGRLRAGRELRRRRLRVFLSTPSGVSGLVGVVIVVLIGIVAPLLLSGPATQINTLDIYASPSSHHLLGTDSLGRDVLARVLVATRLSLEVGALAALVAFVLGVALGVVIVGSGGRARSVLLRAIDTGIAIPGLLLALLIATIIGVGVESVVLGIGIAGSFGFARITSTLSLSVAGREYVQAARTMGIRGWRLVVRYLLPNMAEPMIIFLGVAVGSSIVAAAGLSFLGIGTQPPSFDWGQMLTTGIQNLYQTPAAALAPAIAIGLTTLVFGLAAEGVARSLNPRLWTSSQFKRRPDGNLGRGGVVAKSQAHEGAGPSDSGDVAVAVRDLVVSYPGHEGPIDVVRGVSLTIHKGEILGVVGESGSGKTTTAMAIAQLTQSPGEVRGQIRINGRDLESLSSRERKSFLGDHVGLVYQDPLASLNPALSIGKQLTEALRTLAGVKRKAAARIAVERLEETRVPTPERQLRRFPHELSGGMRQRAMISMALMRHPTLLIADEPTSALDVSIQAQIMRVIRRASEAHDAAVLLISHNIGLVSQSCDRVIIMYAGTLVEELAVADLMSAASHPYTRALISAIPAIGRPRELALEQIPGEPADASAAPSGCPYHPRCPLAVARCSGEVPELLSIASGAHRVACHVVNEAPGA
jgi:oligopeptide/dipeptide ABC transporter ATP-binding protein